MCYMVVRRKRARRRELKATVVRETPYPDARVGVRELRQNLSVYLERVKKGEVLTVTDHGHDVALLRPLPPSTDVVERLAAEGRVARPTRPVSDLPSPLKLELKRPVSELLIEMRDEERD
jgi:prevent-host-death family protein